MNTYRQTRKIAPHSELPILNKEVLRENAMTPIVIGIEHGHRERRGLLVSAYARDKIEKEILPLVDENTLVILEGRYRRTIFGPTHKKYKGHKRHAEKNLGVYFKTKPHIAWRDPRMFPSHRAALNELIASYQQAVLSKVRQPGLSAKTIPEVVVRVREGLPPHVSPRSLTKMEHVLLWNNAREVREFDKAVVATAKKFRDTHRVIIVCGAAHALAIAHAQHWDLKVFVRDTPKNAQALIASYHMCYVLPRCYQRPVHSHL